VYSQGLAFFVSVPTKEDGSNLFNGQRFSRRHLGSLIAGTDIREVAENILSADFEDGRGLSMD
jgi:hypothetical protein